jgi:hypothetical protein
VAVEKLLPAKFAKTKLRQDALQTRLRLLRPRADLENNPALTGWIATILGNTIKVSATVPYQLPHGLRPVGAAAESMQYCLLTARVQFEDDPVAIAIIVGCAVQVAGRISNYARVGNRAVSVAAKCVQHRFLAFRIELEDGSAANGTVGPIPARCSGAVKIAGLIPNQTADGYASVGLSREEIKHGFMAVWIHLEHAMKEREILGKANQNLLDADRPSHGRP